MNTPYAVETALDVVMFVFWFRFWNASSRDIAFNPYLGFLSQPTDWVMKYLGPAARLVSPRVIAGVIFLLLLLARALFGTLTGPGSLQAHSVALLLGFALMLFKLWAVGLLYLGWRSEQSLNRAEFTVSRLCAPVTDLPRMLRLPAFLLFGIGLMWVFHHGLIAATDPAWSSTRAAGYLVMKALMHWLDALRLISSLMILFVIGSWISLLTQSSGLVYICNEWISFLLGPLRNRPIRIGAFDLTPIILVIGLGLFIGAAMQLLGNMVVFMEKTAL